MRARGSSGALALAVFVVALASGCTFSPDPVGVRATDDGQVEVLFLSCDGKDLTVSLTAADRLPSVGTSTTTVTGATTGGRTTGRSGPPVSGGTGTTEPSVRWRSTPEWSGVLEEGNSTLVAPVRLDPDVEYQVTVQDGSWDRDSITRFTPDDLSTTAVLSGGYDDSPGRTFTVAEWHRAAEARCDDGLTEVRRAAAIAGGIMVAVSAAVLLLALRFHRRHPTAPGRGPAARP